jgi:hypothetical protein
MLRDPFEKMGPDARERLLTELCAVVGGAKLKEGGRLEIVQIQMVLPSEGYGREDKVVEKHPKKCTASMPSPTTYVPVALAAVLIVGGVIVVLWRRLSRA